MSSNFLRRSGRNSARGSRGREVGKRERERERRMAREELEGRRNEHGKKIERK